MLRLPAFASAFLVVLALLSVPGATQAPATAGGRRSAWHRCSNPELDYLGLTCGSARRSRVTTRTRPVRRSRSALTRRAHTSATYRGVLLVNPGGPGGSGLSMPSLADYVPGDVGSTYDWIGFDPRGVGASSPSLHCTRRYFTYNRPSYVPKSAKITRSWLIRNRAYANACANTAAKRALLAHMTTLDTVRDMDLIRQALGASTISYYGFSYGTYLGQVYATQYPSRVGRFVLDGVVNPNRVWAATNFDQDRAFDKNMNVFWRTSPGIPGRSTSASAGGRSRRATTGSCASWTRSLPPAAGSAPTSSTT